MAKANQKVAKNIPKANESMDKTIQMLDGIAESSKTIMPLFSEAILLSKHILMTYKLAFNAGKPNDKK